MTFRVLVAGIDEPLLAGWWAKAQDDPEVMRFWAVTPYVDAPNLGDGWGFVVGMDPETPLVIVRIGFRREERAGRVSFYALRAGRKMPLLDDAWRFVLAIARRNELRSISSVVAETNRASMLWTEKLLGKSWGVEPFGAYDPTLRRWVGLAFFKWMIE